MSPPPAITESRFGSPKMSISSMMSFRIQHFLLRAIWLITDSPLMMRKVFSMLKIFIYTAFTSFFQIRYRSIHTSPTIMGLFSDFGGLFDLIIIAVQVIPLLYSQKTIVFKFIRSQYFVKSRGDDKYNPIRFDRKFFQ